MDIINVARSRLQADLEESTFEISNILEDSSGEDSLERFMRAIRRYSNTMSQLDTLFKLHQEVSKDQNKGEEEQQNEA